MDPLPYVGDPIRQITTSPGIGIPTDGPAQGRAIHNLGVSK